MSSEFNLFDLHDTADTHPRSWICIGGPGLSLLIAEAEQTVREAYALSREALSRKIAENLGCSVGVIKRLFHGKVEYYPIPVLMEIAHILPNVKQKRFLMKIQRATAKLKVNSASAKPLRAAKTLDIKFAKIIGAFMADGSLSAQMTVAMKCEEGLKTIFHENGMMPIIRFSASRNEYYGAITLSADSATLLGSLSKSEASLQTHYVIDLVEEYKDSVEAFNVWMRSVFDVTPTLFMQHRNAWRTLFSNKIIARYLMRYFGAVPGPKTYTAREPLLIQKSPLPIRKAFARGILMFDGSVNTVPAITLSTKSEALWHSVRDILTQDGIATTLCKKNTRGEWTFTTVAHTPFRKLAQYFEPQTQKHKLLLWMFGDLKQDPVIRTGNRVSTEKICMFMQKIRQCDVEYLMKHFDTGHSNVLCLLRILERQKRIRMTNKPDTLSTRISAETSISLATRFRVELFQKAKLLWRKDKEAAQAISVDKGTYSAWKFGKNRIPMRALRKLLTITDTDWSCLNGKIKNVDRIIVEAIAHQKDGHQREDAAVSRQVLESEPVSVSLNPDRA